jgi:hypothetical protein
MPRALVDVGVSVPIFVDVALGFGVSEGIPRKFVEVALTIGEWVEAAFRVGIKKLNLGIANEPAQNSAIAILAKPTNLIKGNMVERINFSFAKNPSNAILEIMGLLGATGLSFFLLVSPEKSGGFPRGGGDSRLS